MAQLRYRLLLSLLSVLVASSVGLADPPHACERECDGGPPRKCYYHFNIEFYYTMSKACFDCPNNVTDCSRNHCIAADGVERGVVVINRQLPGPSIQVCEGDQIIVDVKNSMPAEGTVMHWHGLHMVGTPYMDGVPLVTQCPITPASTFRYNFFADNAGTHFYHSHSGFQRADGVFGPLIIRQSREKDPHSALYDYDHPEHVMLVTDWMGELGVTKFIAHHHDDGDNKPSSMIINGKGRIPKPKNELTAEEMMPLATFSVQQGKRYRFRVISNGFLNCPIQLSIDNHTISVIASDGSPVQSLEVDSVVIDAGERYDFVVNANQAVSSYWIRLHGLMDCTPRRVFQAAILRYAGAPENEPDEILDYDNTFRPGKILNPVNFAPGDALHVTAAELKSVVNMESDWSGPPDYKFFLPYDFYAVNSYEFHDPDLYPVFGVDKNHRLFTPQINHISLKMPPSPPLSQPDVIKPGMLCNESTVANCTQEFCACPYTLQVRLGSLVELIFIDEGVTFDATHPFHIHGTTFRVLAMERLGSTVTVDHIRALDDSGLLKRNLVNAPIKDTVAVPDGGYTIVRFRASNPGYWLMHCHLSFHIEVGMGLLFKVGELEDLPPVPKDFPKCGSWLPAVETREEVTKAITEFDTNVIVDNTISLTESSPSLSSASASNSFDNHVPFTDTKEDTSNATETKTTIFNYQDNFIVPHLLVNGSIVHAETANAHVVSGSLRCLPSAYWAFILLPVFPFMVVR